LLTGASLRKAVKVSLDARAVEVIDVTHEVMGMIESASPRANKGRKSKATTVVVKATPVVVEATPDVEMPADLDSNSGWVEVAEDHAACAVYAYAEKLGIDTADVQRIATACNEMDMLVGLAGMEISERVVWLAGQKAREFDTRAVKPHRPLVAIGRVSTAKPASDGSEASTSRARVVVFGQAATAVIRALRATCGMGFAQIRNVLDTMGANSVADATIRAQMSGGGLKRGEPAALSAEQVEQAKQASQAVLVAC